MNRGQTPASLSDPGARLEVTGREWRWLRVWRRWGRAIHGGWGAWGVAPVFSAVCIIFAGVHARRWRWSALGAAWLAVTIGDGLLLSHAQTGGVPGGQTLVSITVPLFCVCWLGSVATARALRPDYERCVQERWAAGIAYSRAQLAEEGRALARRDPEVAREMGVGRPDLPGADHLGLLDLNAVPATELMRVPGVTARVARRIVDARERLGGVASVQEVADVLDLAPEVAEELERVAVCLPFRP